jgi:hypothetical protein
MAPRLTPLDHVIVPAGGALHAIVDDVWQRVAGGLNGRWPPWGLPTLATLGENGPRARVLALRASDGQMRTLTFHTDARADKVREITENPSVTVLFWDPEDGIEARFGGTAALHLRDAVAHAAWQGVSPLRRLASRTLGAPGARLATASRFDALPVSGDADAGYDNFAVIEVVVDHLDWLWVGAEDMRRASFAWTGAGWAGSWTVP